MLQQALYDQLMVDPDLAFQNEGNAALTIGFDRSIPPIATSPELVTAIRDKARMALLDGGIIPSLPDPREDAEAKNYSSAVSALHMAQLVSFAQPCAENVLYSTIWAARLPDYAAIVPRGSVMEALGKDEGDCRLRAVSYRTQLPPEDVAQFYYTLATRAQLAPRYYLSGDEGRAIIAQDDGAGLAVNARAMSKGLTAVDLVTLEKAAP